jgi:N-acyl-D-amino-acid deacylase
MPRVACQSVTESAVTGMSDEWTIRGGTLLDGEGGFCRSDLAIRDGRISRLAPQLPPAPHDLDATGLMVSPGVIDIHCHSEYSAFVYPRAESKILAGVTTDVSGNCGASPFPMAGEFLDRRQAEWRHYGLVIDWRTPEEYYARAEAAPSSINRAMLAGHGAIRAAVVGYAGRPTDAAERRRMRSLLEEAMRAGAYGISSGLIYPPGCYADVDELSDLAHVAAEFNGYYTSHIRSEGARLVEAVDEFLEILRRSGARGQLSHLKAAGAANWHKTADVLNRLRTARAEGLEVYADRYPYLASMTDLDSMLLPDWAVEGGREAELARLADPATRRRLIDDIHTRHPEADYFDRIIIAEVTQAGPQDVVGKTLRQAAEAAGADSLEFAFDLVTLHQTQVAAIYFSMSEENLRDILREPYVSIGSDSSLRHLPKEDRPAGGLAHPRAYGSTARFLGTYVRQEGLMDWPEGIRRLTSLPADVVGLKDRGRLREGAWADIVVFDRQTVADRSTYQRPWAAPAGIKHVFVNGTHVVADGAHTGATPGRVLRKGR